MLSLQLPLTLLQKVASRPHAHKSRRISSPARSPATLSKAAIFHCTTSRSCPISQPFFNLALPYEHAVAEKGQHRVKFGDGVPKKVDGDRLPAGLLRELMPKHVAVIMDGNARWARAKGLATSAGHEAGVRALRKVVECCCKWGVEVLTVFAFSSENWFRSEEEINLLMSLFERVVMSEIQNFVRDDIRLCVIGDSSKLPNSLQEVLKKAEEMTKDNEQLDLLVAVNYSGRNDIVQACQSIAHKVKERILEPSDISATIIEEELATSCTSHTHPDLLIRTSGEQRLSNFLLWQSAYTELFFSPTYWPDFGEDNFAEALRHFQHRQRRFGGRLPKE